MGHVVVDADGEMILRLLRLEVVEHRLDHRGREFLGGQAVAAADDARQHLDAAPVVGEALANRGGAILEQRLACRARLLRAVQNRNGPHGRRQRLDKPLAVKRTI